MRSSKIIEAVEDSKLHEMDAQKPAALPRSSVPKSTISNIDGGACPLPLTGRTVDASLSAVNIPTTTNSALPSLPPTTYSSQNEVHDGVKPNNGSVSAPASVVAKKPFTIVIFILKWFAFDETLILAFSNWYKPEYTPYFTQRLADASR